MTYARSVTLSTGWQNTSYGLSDEYMDDKSFVVSSNSVAFGGVYHISKKRTSQRGLFPHLLRAQEDE